MFDDTQNENLGNLERLSKAFDNILTKKIIRELKKSLTPGRVKE